MKEKTKKLVKLIKNILLQSNISNEQKIYAMENVKELIDLTSGKDAKAYVLQGKIDMLLGEQESSINSFKTAITINPLLASPYYGLFKIYIVDEQYEKALDYIILFQEYSGINCELYISLLKKYLYNEEVNIKNKDNVLGNYGIYQPILKNYNLLIDNLNKSNYDKALIHLDICIKLTKNKNYHINFKELENIIKKINVVHKEMEKVKNISNLKNAYLNSNNHGTNHLYLRKLFELDSDDINILILLVENCISLSNYQMATYYLNIAKTKLAENSIRINYLEEKIKVKSKTTIDYLNEMKKKLYINNLVLNNDIESAIDLCCLYYQEYEDANYYYLAGTILYNNNYYEEALYYFEQYKNIGQSNLKQTYYYLYYIYNWLKDDDKASYYANLIYQLSYYNGLSISLTDFESNILLYAHNFSAENMIELEKNLLRNILVDDNTNKIENIQNNNILIKK